MKLFRILAWAVLAVLGVLAVALALVFALFDGNRLKAEISQAVLERYQRTLVIEGQPQLSVWPDVGVVLGAVSLSERGSSQPFAAMQSARVSVALLPLLGRQVQVRELQVKGLKAAVIRRKDGSLSIDDLLKRGNGLPAEQTHAQQPQGLRIDMAGLALTDGQLSWRDERSGQQLRIDSVNLSTGRVQADTGAKTATKVVARVRADDIETVDGRIDKKSVAATIRRRQDGFQACYETALKSNSKLGGKLVVEFTIAEGGKVTSARVINDGLNSGEVSNCVLGLLKRLRFPEPSDGEVAITNAFVFQPGG